jgi:hypothetical protein
MYYQMRNEVEDRRRKGYTSMRSIKDIGMGIIIIGVGLLIIFADKLGIGISTDKTISYLFGGLCLLYGPFRLYRGFRKDYF